MGHKEFSLVTVVGAGIMGTQIAQLFAQVGGYPVMLHDTDAQLISARLNSIKANLNTYFLKKGLMTKEQLASILNRITTTTNLKEATQRADFIIESVYENLDLKKSVFKQISGYCPPEAIIASNSSNLNITKIASSVSNKSRVIGMHFFTPVITSKLVEIIKGKSTSESTIQTVVSVVKKLGKEPLVCQNFSYGFLANRAYTAMVLEAVQIVWEKVSPPADVDKALRMAYGLPIGPLELFDSLGIWKIMAISESDKIKELGLKKGRLHPLIKVMVESGYAGGKGEKGIYDYYNDRLKP